MWGIPKDPLPFSQVFRGLLPGGESIGEMQPSPLPPLTPPTSLPRFHLKLGMGTLSDHSVFSHCIFTSLLSLEIALGRGDPGASGEDGSFIIPVPYFQQWSNSVLAKLSHCSSLILLAHAF